MGIVDKLRIGNIVTINNCRDKYFIVAAIGIGMGIKIIPIDSNYSIWVDKTSCMYQFDNIQQFINNELRTN